MRTHAVAYTGVGEVAVYSCARTSTTPPTEPRVSVAFQMAYSPRLDRSTGVAGVAVIAAPVALVRFAEGTASTVPPGLRFASSCSPDCPLGTDRRPARAR